MAEKKLLQASNTFLTTPEQARKQYLQLEGSQSFCRQQLSLTGVQLLSLRWWTKWPIVSERQWNWRKQNKRRHFVARKNGSSGKESTKSWKGKNLSIRLEYENNTNVHYNISCHSSTGFESSRLFHGQTPYNFLNWKSGLKPEKKLITKSQTLQNFLELRNSSSTMLERTLCKPVHIQAVLPSYRWK